MRYIVLVMCISSRCAVGDDWVIANIYEQLVRISKRDTSDLLRCTVHSVVYLINTPKNSHIFI